MSNQSCQILKWWYNTKIKYKTNELLQNHSMERSASFLCYKHEGMHFFVYQITKFKMMSSGYRRKMYNKSIQTLKLTFL